ncbi:MAG: hypothetical protein EZS28_025061, partial [Streblomastix strix]
MSHNDQYYWIVANYEGQEDDDEFMPVSKFDIVRVLRKDAIYFTIEKDGSVGKIPHEYLRECAPEQAANKSILRMKSPMNNASNPYPLALSPISFQ